MATKEKVCRTCKRFVDGERCPICGTSNFSRSWKGVVVIYDTAESEIAKSLGITMPGKYCVWVR